MQIPLENANAACAYYFNASLLESQSITIVCSKGGTFRNALCMHVEQSATKISDKFS